MATNPTPAHPAIPSVGAPAAPAMLPQGPHPGYFGLPGTQKPAKVRAATRHTPQNIASRWTRQPHTNDNFEDQQIMRLPAVIVLPPGETSEMTKVLNYTKVRNFAWAPGKSGVNAFHPAKKADGVDFRHYADACIGYLIGEENLGGNQCTRCFDPATNIYKGRFARCVSVPWFKKGACMCCVFPGADDQCSIARATKSAANAARVAAMAAQNQAAVQLQAAAAQHAIALAQVTQAATQVTQAATQVTQAVTQMQQANANLTETNNQIDQGFQADSEDDDSDYLPKSESEEDDDSQEGDEGEVQGDDAEEREEGEFLE